MTAKRKTLSKEVSGLIQSTLQETGGVFAMDCECFILFKDAFDPIIAALHHLDVDQLSTSSHVFLPSEEQTFFSLAALPSKFTIEHASLEFRRNITGFAYCPMLEDADREELYDLIRDAISEASSSSSSSSPFAVHKLSELTEEQLEDLDGLGIPFRPFNHVLEVASFYDNWPVGRGIASSTFDEEDEDATVSSYIHICHREHLEVSVLGKNIDAVCSKGIELMETLSAQLDFDTTEQFGFSTSLLNWLGHATKLSFTLSIPLPDGQGDDEDSSFSVEDGSFKQLLSEYGLMVRSTRSSEGECLLCLETTKMLFVQESELLKDVGTFLSRLDELI